MPGQAEASLTVLLKARDDATPLISKAASGLKGLLIGSFGGIFAAMEAVRIATGLIAVHYAQAAREAASMTGNIGDMIDAQIQSNEAWADMARAVPFIGRAVRHLVDVATGSEGLRKLKKEIVEAQQAMEKAADATAKWTKEIAAMRLETSGATDLQKLEAEHWAKRLERGTLIDESVAKEERGLQALIALEKRRQTERERAERGITVFEEGLAYTLRDETQILLLDRELAEIQRNKAVLQERINALRKADVAMLTAERDIETKRGREELETIQSKARQAADRQAEETIRVYTEKERLEAEYKKNQMRAEEQGIAEQLRMERTLANVRLETARKIAEQEENVRKGQLSTLQTLIDVFGTDAEARFINIKEKYRALKAQVWSVEEVRLLEAAEKAELFGGGTRRSGISAYESRFLRYPQGREMEPAWATRANMLNAEQRDLLRKIYLKLYGPPPVLKELKMN